MDFVNVQFLKYELGDQADDACDPEYVWRIQKLNEIISGKRGSEIDFSALSKYFDCLYELHAEDVYKLCVSMISWHISGANVYGLFVVLASRMGFLWRIQDIGVVADKEIFSNTFEQRLSEKHQAREFRRHVIQACPEEFSRIIYHDLRSWIDFFQANSGDYVFRLFLRWYMLSWYKNNH